MSSVLESRLLVLEELLATTREELFEAKKLAQDAQDAARGATYLAKRLEQEMRDNELQGKRSVSYEKTTTITDNTTPPDAYVDEGLKFLTQGRLPERIPLQKAMTALAYKASSLGLRYSVQKNHGPNGFELFVEGHLFFSFTAEEDIIGVTVDKDVFQKDLLELNLTAAKVVPKPAKFQIPEKLLREQSKFWSKLQNETLDFHLRQMGKKKTSVKMEVGTAEPESKRPARDRREQAILDYNTDRW